MAAANEHPAEGPERPRILLVDDDALHLETLGRRLERAGFSVHSLADGAEALKHLDSIQPDVVLLDLHMPGVSGLEVLAAIRRTMDAARLPVIVSTALHESELLVEAMAHGANDFVGKPVDLSAAIARIRAQLRLRAVAEQNRSLTTQLAQTSRRLEQASLDLIRLNIDLEVESERQRAAGAVPLRRLHAVAHAGDLAARGFDRDMVMARMLEEGLGIMGARGGAVLLFEGDGLRSAYSVGEIDVPRTISASGTGPSPALFAGAPTLLVGDPFRTATPAPPVAAAVAPLLDARGSPLGALVFVRTHEVPFVREDEDVLRALATLASTAFERTQLTRASILRLVRLAALHDPSESAAHVLRVAAASVLLYDAWAIRHGIEASERAMMRDGLHAGALLHDVGKAAIPEEILKKPGRLTPGEYDIMKRHTLAGADLFEGCVGVLDRIAYDITLGHHERWDGAGYPGVASGDGHLRGRRGDEVPIHARIVALADVYDALSTERGYKEAWPEHEVLALLRAERGGHFDPELVDIALSIAPALRATQDRYPEARR